VLLAIDDGDDDVLVGDGLADGQIADTAAVLQAIKKLDTTITVIILTGYGSIPTAMQALKLGADSYLGKPADTDQILAAYRDLETGSTEKSAPTTVH